MVLESPYTRAICDMRPAMVGHTLVCSKAHVASAFDLTEPSYSHLRVMQQEISRRIHEAFNEVGVYEHGRSALCRFHTVNPGHIHTHLHILPVSFDLIERSGYEHKWNGPPEHSIKAEDRYLYQEIGNLPLETWAVGELPVRRHFVRAELEAVLSRGGRPWIPLTASPDDHDDAVEETVSLISKYDVLEKPHNVIALLGSGWAEKNKIANALGKSTGFVVIDVDLICRFWAWLSLNAKQAPSSLSERVTESFVKGNAVFPSLAERSAVGGALRFAERMLDSELFDETLTPYLREIRNEKNTMDRVDLIVSMLISRQSSVLVALEIGQHTSAVNPLKVYLTTGGLSTGTEEGERQVESGGFPILETAAPRWSDLRVSPTGLTPEDLSDLICEGWRLRFGFDISERPI